MNSRAAQMAGIACAAALAGRAPAAVAQHFPARPPIDSVVPALTLPPIYQTTLANGLTVITVEDHRVPLVSLALAVPAGRAADPPGKAGTAQLAATLLTKGTPTRSADSIAAEIESVGGTLSAAVGRDFFTLHATVLSDGLDAATDLIGALVLRATYPTGELELARARERSAVAFRRSQPAQLAQQAFTARVYGAHPYGREESDSSLRAITRDDVVAWARIHLAPQGALLVFAGDITADHARAVAQRALGPWSGLAARSEVAVGPRSATRILLIDRPSSAQATILLGNVAIRAADPGFDAATVAVALLGGGPDSRLFRALRTRNAWAYDVAASLVPSLDAGTLEIRLSVPDRVADSAIALTLAEMGRMRSDVVPDSDLIRTTRHMTQAFPLDVETAQDVASHISTAEELGLGAQYVENYVSRIRSLDAAQVRDAARRVMHPDSTEIVVVGNGAALYERLKPLAPVDVVDVDGRPMTAAYLLARDRAIVDTSQLVPHSDSLRIVDARGRVVGAVRQSLTRTDSGFVYVRRETIVPSGVARSTRALLTTGTFHLRVVQLRDSFPGGAQQYDLEVSRGVIRGNAVLRSSRGADTVRVDTAFAPGTVLDALLGAYMPRLPLNVGAQRSLTTFDVSTHSTAPAEVRVSDVKTVTVPAGTFEAYPVEVVRGSTHTTYFVTTVSPRRIVAVDVPDQGLRFELVASDP